MSGGIRVGPAPPARGLGGGLPVPRVQDPDLARWLQDVAQWLDQLGGDVGNLEDRPTGRGSTVTVPAAGPEPDTPAIPTLATPPKPKNVSAIGGLEMIAVYWDNPFRDYVNHAQARIYRATVDAFDQAVEVGQSAYVTFIDMNVNIDTEYWYWVRFESTASVLGPASDSATAEATEDPATAVRRVSDAVLNDPLTRDLLSDVDGGPATAAEIRAYGSLISVLTSEAQQEQINSLESHVQGNLGPEQNVFEGATKEEAIAALDAYGVANPEWLEQYDGDPTIEVELRWYVDQVGG